MRSKDIEYVFCWVIISQLGEQDVQVQRTQNSLDFFPCIMLGSW